MNYYETITNTERERERERERDAAHTRHSRSPLPKDQPKYTNANKEIGCMDCHLDDAARQRHCIQVLYKFTKEINVLLLWGVRKMI